MSTHRLTAPMCLVLVFFLMAASSAHAGPSVQAGPYTLQLRTDPVVVPVGRAWLYVTVASAGQPVQGADVRVLARMPSMSMGEREQRARPVEGSPGVYRASAGFGMEGAYEVSVSVRSGLGEGRGAFPLRTGVSSEAAGSGGGRAGLVALAVSVVAVLLVLARRPGLLTAHLGAIVLLLVIGGASWYAVSHWRRPGAMTPIEAQVMEMNVPAPPGALPVEVGEVSRGTVSDVVRYSGQAVGFVEQDVVPRFQGVILDMPVYVGTRVKAGDVLARLDTTQVAPQVAERRASVAMTELEARAARGEAAEAAAARNEAASEVGMKHGEIDEAQARLASIRTQTVDAHAGLKAALADQAYWREELKRSRQLLAEGAFSTEEHQRTVSQAAAADAKVEQARARARQVEADIAAAEAGLRKAEADLHSHHAHVAQTQAAYVARRDKAEAAQAAVAQARASLEAVSAQEGYAVIRAQADGLVTQRLISPGTLVSPGQAILRVAQTKPMRLQANVAMTDLARIEVGTRVSVWPQDAADRAIEAKVTAVQPAVDPVARTGVVEALVPNKDARFVPGGFLTMAIPVRRATDALTVPAGAVRERPAASGRPGAHRFVWVVDDGRARSVDVDVLASDGVRTAVKGDLKAGMRVVSGGGEYLHDDDEVSAIQAAPTRAGLTVEVTDAGFTPDRLEVEKGKPVALTFIRRTEQTCATDVVFPDLGLHEQLPMDKPVRIVFTPRVSGDLVFTCGMKMIRGTVVAR